MFKILKSNRHIEPDKIKKLILGNSTTIETITPRISVKGAPLERYKMRVIFFNDLLKYNSNVLPEDKESTCCHGISPVKGKCWELNLLLAKRKSTRKADRKLSKWNYLWKDKIINFWYFFPWDSWSANKTLQ